MQQPTILSENPAEAEDYQAIWQALGEMAMVSITDAEGNIIFVNDTFLNAIQYSRAEVMGKNHRILKSPHMSDATYDDMWNTIQQGKMWRGEIENKTKNGSLFWADTSIFPLLNKNNKPDRYVSVRFDITARKQSELLLQKQNSELQDHKKAFLNVLEDVEAEKERYRQQVTETQKFALAVEGISEHVVITDVDGVILYANPAAERITGFSPAEVVGKKAGSKELWGGHMEKEFYEKMWHTIKVEKKTFSGEIKNKRKNGEEYIAVSSISPVLNKDGEVEFFVGIERDVTREKEIDLAKSEFVSLASHQLRTPLSSISWYTEMLLAGDAGAMNSQQEEYLDEIYKGNRRMIELVNALLNVSRIELGTFSIDPKLTNISILAQSVVDELRPLIQQKNIQVTLQIPKELPEILVDSNLYRMVIQNIVANAVKYTPDYGSVSVSITTYDKGAVFGSHTCETDVLSLTVTDTGMGIPERQQHNIFTKLFRADNAKMSEIDGTGLGLYMVKSILDHSGGSVWFDSVEGSGTTFYVTVPTHGMRKKIGTKTLS